jgi:hypothetical protein
LILRFETEPLFGDTMIAYDTDVKEFISLINSVIPAQVYDFSCAIEILLIIDFIDSQKIKKTAEQPYTRLPKRPLQQ